MSFIDSSIDAVHNHQSWHDKGNVLVKDCIMSIIPTRKPFVRFLELMMIVHHSRRHAIRQRNRRKPR